jgi:subtilisin family serine protease
MKAGIFALLTVALLTCSKADFGQGQCAYRIDFTDKNSTTYRLDSPQYYLSPRSIHRRSHQSIPIDSTDLPVNRNYVDSVLTITGGMLHEVSKWKNLMVVLVYTADTAGIEATLLSRSFIKNVQLEGYYPDTLHLERTIDTISNAVEPPFYQSVTNYNTFYTNTWGQTQMVNGESLYSKGYSGAGMMISVLDAGFLHLDTAPFGFDSLRNSGRIVDRYNFSYGKTDVYGHDLNGDAHGTMVLSTMAGYVPYTYVGTAPLAYYALYETEIEPSEQPLELINMLCGMERADSAGTDVISSSLGYNTFDNSVYDFVFATDLDGKTTIAAIAANMATQKGIVVVITAGNEGGDNWNRLLTPGDADSALTIGNVDPYEVIAGSSGFGYNAAGRVKPDVCAQGNPANLIDGEIYMSASGTSFSTPQVAGWAACLWQAFPEATPYQIRLAIDQCASKWSDPDTHYGYGIPDFGCAFAALESVQNLKHANSWVSVYPNPVTDVILCSVNPGVGAVKVRVLDLLGRVVLQKNYSAAQTAGSLLTTPASNLAQGVYLFEVSTSNQRNITRITKL